MNVKTKHILLIRYLVAGGLSFVFELTILLILNRVFNLSGEVSTAIAFWFGFVAAFILQKLLAFKDYEKTIKNISKQIFAYSLLVIFNYIFTITIVALSGEDMLIVSRVIAIMLTTIWNFVLYKKVIFKNSI